MRDDRLDGAPSPFQSRAFDANVRPKGLTLRVLYGVVGEGMGHATRSRVVVEHLARAGHVPLVDTYSHTARGLPWPNHEWLWQALSWACHRAGGMPLLTAVGAAMATAACAVAYGLMRARPSVNFVLALIGIPLASVVWALRPQVASLLLLVLLLRLLTDERTGRLLLIPPLFLLWANLPGAVALESGK